jgi:hypothetical protein
VTVNDQVALIDWFFSAFSSSGCSRTEESLEALWSLTTEPIWPKIRILGRYMGSKIINWTGQSNWSGTGQHHKIRAKYKLTNFS